MVNAALSEKPVPKDLEELELQLEKIKKEYTQGSSEKKANDPDTNKPKDKEDDKEKQKEESKMENPGKEVIENKP